MKYANGLDTRDEIVKQARKLFFTKGFKNTGIREIAKASNVTSGALYRHFKNKEDILDSIISPYTDDWLKQSEMLHKEFSKEIEKANSKREIESLFVRGEAKWLYAYIKENVDIWEFVIFNSDGTKYKNFFDDYIRLEANMSIKALDKYDKQKNYLKIASETEIYYFIKGVYTMALSLFNKDFDEEKRLNFLMLIEDVNRSFWKKIFMIED